jgi:hypothetical protein
MYSEWKETEFPKKYFIRIWNQQDQEVDQEIDSKMKWGCGRIVGGEEWQEKMYNREEWKKLLRAARNLHILQMPMEWMNEVWIPQENIKQYVNTAINSCRFSFPRKTPQMKTQTP